ncbi:MAG: hypothetical protein K0S47_1908 [Herbinix sp.]|nr:hypothetical protein [Herbinix sp.]
MIAAREQQKVIDLQKLFAWFIIYSFIGWVYETTYCSVTTLKFASRGFLYGPLCPIYGCTIVAMILLTDKIRKKYYVFLYCALIATMIEYFVSYSMELIFHRRWWNYSDMFLNINGRVCIFASILFGICGVLITRYIHPAIVRFAMQNISDRQFKLILKVITFLFVFDIYISFKMSI